MGAAVLVLCLVAAPALGKEGTATRPEVDLPEAPAPSSTVGTPAPGEPSRPIIEPPLSTPPVPVAAPPPGVPPPPSVPAPPPDPKRHRHLDGYVHLELGGGYMRTAAAPSSAAYAFSGWGVPMSFAVGWAVAEDWILAGDAWFLAAPSTQVGPSSTTVVSAIGLNLTRYLMPANVFLSVTPSLSVLSINDRDNVEVRRTDYGFGAKVAVAKEWWVGDHWGLGIAGSLFLAVNGDQGTGASTWTSFGGGVAFSATFN